MPVQQPHGHFLGSLSFLNITAVAGRGVGFIALGWLEIGKVIRTRLVFFFFALAVHRFQRLLFYMVQRSFQIGNLQSAHIIKVANAQKHHL